MAPGHRSEEARVDWCAALGSASPDPTIVLDDRMQVVWRNPAAVAQTGVSDDDAGSVAAATRVHPDDLVGVLEQVVTARRTGGCAAVRYRVAAPAGDRWFECTGWVADLDHLAPGHMMIRFLVIGHHDSDWEASVDPFVALTDASSLGFALVGERGLVGYRNPMFATWFPLDVVASIDDMADQVRPQDRLPVLEWSKDLLAGVDRNVTVAIEHDDGRITWLDLEAVTRTSELGQATLGITAHDITELRHEATHDHLSGLLNRAAVIRSLERALVEARGTGTNVGALFCDLDNFKLVNDGLGHQVGDQLLERVAQRIRSAVREVDVVGRLGGDEFLIVARGVEDEQELVAIAARIGRAVADDLKGTPFPVSLSIGAAIAPDGHSSAGALVRDADAAMYRAKTSGKARTEVFRAEMRDRAEHQIEVGRLLRTGLDEGWVTVHYQPIFGRRDGRWVLHALEALARCPLPDGSYLSPDEFVPVAEQTGLIAPLGHRVRTVVGSDLARWSDAHGGDFAVWVNVSVQELDREGLAAGLAGRLAELGLDPWRVGVEVTESALASGRPVAMATLAELRRNGMQVIIDDFGTGYSSLGALKDSPADVIKIDRRFIAGVLDAPADLAIVRSVAEIGRVSGLDIVAEGVETADQLAALMAVGCTAVQGYHLARPMPAAAVDEQIGAWLRGNLVTV